MRPRHATSEHAELTLKMKRMCRRLPRRSLHRAVNDRPVWLMSNVLARCHGSPSQTRNLSGSRRGKRRARVELAIPSPFRGGWTFGKAIRVLVGP